MIRKHNKTFLIFDNSITLRSKFNTGIQRTVKNLQYNLDGKVINNVHIKFSPINESWFDRFDFPGFSNDKHILSIFLHIVSIFFHIILFIRTSIFGRLISSFIFFNKTFYILLLHKIYKNNIYFVFSDSNWTRRGYFFLFINKRFFGNKNFCIFYDLGPYKYPNFFDKYLVTKFTKFWNKTYKLIDKFICISDTVKKEICLHWNLPAAKATSFNLGSDLSYKKSMQNFYKVTSIDPYKNYLVVGSIEPRKNNEYILKNFINLLDNNKALSNKLRLIFIYSNSWKSDNFFKTLNSSKYLNKNIFLLNEVSDSELKNFFSTSYALINSSIYEGYGLGIQEALNYNLKVFCSNITVFKELYNDNAIFFDIDNDNHLKDEILKDLNDQSLFNANMDNVLTWNQSALNLIKIINNEIQDTYNSK